MTRSSNTPLPKLSPLVLRRDGIPGVILTPEMLSIRFIAVIDVSIHPFHSCVDSS